MTYIFGWLFFALIVAFIATTKNRSFIGWFLISAIFSPVIGLIFVLISGENMDSNSLGEDDTKKCFHCAEEIKSEAMVCRYCGRDVSKGENIPFK